MPSHTQVGIGGGQTLSSNLKKALSPYGYEFVESGEYDLLFIAGATLCDRETFAEAARGGKPIVTRIDNILEDSKNRNTGMPRLREFSAGSDVVIYQSEWAKKLLSPIAGDGVVIYNGVDTDIFHPRSLAKDWDGIRVFYGKYGRGDGKNFNVVQYFWREYSIDSKSPDDTLVLVGRFADEIQRINHPFEFHDGEEYEYRGVIDDPSKLADIMRGCDVALLPYFADACSNTVLEAQACGLPVLYDRSGGTPEIVKNGIPINGQLTPMEYVRQAIENGKIFSRQSFVDDFGLERMGREYHRIFSAITMKTHAL